MISPNEPVVPVSLSIYQSLWAMEDLPCNEPVQWTLPERVSRIAGAGFDGLSVDLGARQVPAAADLAALLRSTGLCSAVNAFVRDDRSMDEALRYADTIGAPLIILCAQVFSQDLGFLAATVQRWHARAAAAGVSVQLETHRGTMTNDLRTTVALLDHLDPAITLAADLSHYVCGCELPDRSTPEIEALMDAVLDRSASLQGRVASRCQVQIPLGHVEHQHWVERFRDWWTRGFASMAARGWGDPMFCAELGTRPYAPTAPDGRELSDRWAEALVLRDWAKECFEAAVPAVSPA
jgi:hypothetical protein